MEKTSKSVGRTENTKRLALSGIMLALGTILSLIKIYQAPFGGSVTACAMLPVLIVMYMYGVKWGLGVGFVFGVLQAVLGATASSAFAGQNVGTALAICLIDYLAAYTVLALGGVFKGKIKNNTVAFALGAFVAVSARYICHIASGYIFYGSYADWFFGEEFTNQMGQWLVANCSPKLLALAYSTIYNGGFMLPEIAITTVVSALVISLIPPVRREMTKAR